MLWKTHKKSVILFTVGGITFVGGLCLLFAFPPLLYYIINQNAVIDEGSIIYEFWKELPIPLKMRTYFFNVTNPEEIIQGKKPKLKEVGPYTYKVYPKKEDVVYHNDSTASFRETKTFYFSLEDSIGPESDMVLSPNGPLLVATGLMKNYPSFLQIIASLGFDVTGEHLFVKHSIKDLMFHGYPDVMAMVGPLVRPDMPRSDGRFGWFYGRNGTDSGRLRSKTGVNDLPHRNLIQTWNNKKALNVWRGKECNKINATDGVYQPKPDAPAPFPELISIFFAELCRSWPFVKDRESDVSGIPTWRYSSPWWALASYRESPENICFNTPRQLQYGALDMGPCQFGVPVVLSYPHFYDAHPSYREAVDGMKPDKEKHQFYVDVETNLGIVIGVHARFQLNIHMERMSTVRQLILVPDVVLPVMWQELEGGLDYKYSEFFKNHFNRPLFYSYVGGVLFIPLGLVLMIVGVAHFLYIRKNMTKLDNQGRKVHPRNNAPKPGFSVSYVKAVK